MKKRILVLAPHTDDGEFGCGGAIAKYVEKGNDVFYAAFSACEQSVLPEYPSDILITEVKAATQVLGIPRENLILFDYEVRTFPSYRQQILDDMIDLNNKIKPDLVIVPSSNDTHQDHQTIYFEALRAFKKTSSIWGYEHPWNNLKFSTDIFVELEEKHIRRKIYALNNYKSQNSRTYFDEKYIRALASTRGTQINSLFAETFECIRLLVV